MSSPALSALIFTLLCSLRMKDIFYSQTHVSLLTLGISSPTFPSDLLHFDPWYCFSYSLYFPESSSPFRGGALFYFLSDKISAEMVMWSYWQQKLRDICDTDVCEGRDRVCGCLKSVQIHNLKLTFYTSTLIKSILSNPNVSLGSITLEIFHLPNLYFRKSINWTWLVFYHFLGSCKMWTHLKDCGKIEVPSWQKGCIFSLFGSMTLSCNDIYYASVYLQ